MIGGKCSYSCEFSKEVSPEVKLLDSMFGSGNLTYCVKQGRDWPTGDDCPYDAEGNLRSSARE